MFYVRILQDLGFDTNSMLVPSMELMDSLDHPEVFERHPIVLASTHHHLNQVLKEMIPTLSLQAAISHLLCVSIILNDCDNMHPVIFYRVFFSLVFPKNY